MPIFPNPAGGSMEVRDEAEARARGWTPSMGSFGVNSYPSGGGGDRPGGGGGGGDLDSLRRDILAGFQASSGMSVRELEERKRQFDEEMALKEREWEREGLPRLEIDRRLADARIQEIAIQQEIARGNLGLDFVKTAASMGGPGDVFQMQDLLRGARSMADLPNWLTALKANTPMAAFQGQGAGTPLAQTPELLMQQLGGTGARPAGALAAPGAPAVPAPAAPVAPLIQPVRGTPNPTSVNGLGVGYNPGDVGPAYALNGRVLQETRGADGRVIYNDLGPAPAGVQPYSRVTEQMLAPAAQSAAAPGAAPSPGQPVSMSLGQPVWQTVGAPTLAGARTYVAGNMPQAPAAATGQPTVATHSPAGYNMDAALSAIGDFFKRGATGVAPGVLESMDDAELQSLSSGGRKLGYDVPAWMRQWQRSRIGQTSLQAA